MKKIFSIILVLTLVTTVFTTTSIAGPNNKQVRDLIADGGSEATAIDVGDVELWIDGDYLYVDIIIEDTDWEMISSHIHIGDTLDDFPLTRKGNPQIGRFAYGEDTYDPPVNGDTFTSEVLVPLMKINEIGCRGVYVSGIAEMHISDGTEISIDYGDGSCDNLAELTINGETEIIELHRHRRGFGFGLRQ